MLGKSTVGCHPGVWRSFEESPPHTSAILNNEASPNLSIGLLGITDIYIIVAFFMV